LIVFNLCALLNMAIRAHRLDMFACPGAGVRNPGLRNFQPIPDVVVVPGRAGHDNYSERFLLVTEVLSPSNTRTEIGLKLRRYCEAPDNLYALVVDPREFMVEVHSRSRDWQPLRLAKPDDVIEMPEFGLHCRVVDLYRGTVLDPQRG
jgi:Uma2 family endonuclease